MWLGVTLFMAILLANFFIAILLFPYVFLRQQAMVGGWPASS